MLILIGLTLLLIAGIVKVHMYNKKNNSYYDDDVVGMIFSICAGIALVIALIMLLMIQMGTQSEIQAFYSVQQTMETARQDSTISTLELATIQRDAIEKNAWLAQKQYWNTTVFDIWIPDKIMELNPIK